MLANLAVLALPLLAAAKRSQLTFGTAVAPVQESTSTLPPYEWLASSNIRPCPHAEYSLAQLQDAAIATFGEPAVWRCVAGKLTSVFWSENEDLTSSCPETGIKWFSAGAEPQAVVASPPTGEVILEVVVNGTKKGCLGEGGMWSLLPPCAAFNVTSFNETTPESYAAVPNNFTLTGVKGPCSAAKGVFACKNASTPSFFQSEPEASLLVFNLTSQFYAPLVPVIPWMKLPILTTPKLGSVNVTIEYSPAPIPPVA
ncbi:ribonuclease T2 [Pseudohyphozyma bogoriensis]|nr:ribonuclease T2 [Pseudohyphozyma bogoriensis]